jgi:hypothetical protein
MLDGFVTTKKEWKPFTRQEMAISVPNTVLELFYGGAAGGGKTDTGICIPLVKRCKFTDRLWYQHPLFKGLIIRRTIPELKKEMIKRCHEYIPQTGANYNATDRVWTWPWGAQLFLNAAEHEDDVRRYDTEQFSYIFFEELTSFTDFMYLYMMSRCRPADEDLPSLMFSASNPGNIGHGWVRKRFVEPCKEGGKIIRQFFFDKQGNYILEENPNHINFGKPKYIQRIFIKALGSDNPHLLKNDPDYLIKLEALPEAEKAAKLYGDWWTFSGQVFDSFRSKKYPDEPENAIHVISPFEIPHWWPRISAIDWGYKAATVCYWGAISPTGRCYIYREYYVRETEVAIWASEIGEQSRNENIRCLVLDTNAWENKGEEKTIAQQFQDAFTAAYGQRTLLAEPASKGRISGKTLIQEFLRWKPKHQLVNYNEQHFDPEEAARLKRLSESAWLKYIELFAPPAMEDNIPRIQIFDNCDKLIECIPLCVYDDKNVEDVKEWQVSDSQVGDDPYDAFRYLIKRVDRYIKESHAEFQRREKEDRIVNEFQTTGNQTTYYRKMENLEKKGNNKRVSVRRAGFAQRLYARSRLHRM